MENDRFKELFKDFNPEISDDSEFMSDFIGRLDSIEFIKEQQTACRRKTRKAFAIAFVAGFISGILFTLLLPMVFDMISGFDGLSLPLFGFSLPAVETSRIMLGLLAAGMTSIISINAYRISFEIMDSKDYH